MSLLLADHEEFQRFTDGVEAVIADISGYAQAKEIAGLRKIIDNFKMKTDDFYREDRKLNIGVVGQVKAGKSSFLNTLLFDGREVLPKASTPKTATLTKMEYSEEKNVIRIEYYTPEEWESVEENAGVDLEEETYTACREIMEMVNENHLIPAPYLQKGSEMVEFETYEELLGHLNDYVGADGKYTPIVKAVTLELHKEEFKGLSIVDTPGLNDPIYSRTVRTREFMEVCDVVFFLSQSGSFLDESDWTLLSAQLPQKGVKRLVLIGSKFDSGVRDVLRLKEDDPFADEDDDNTADNIPDACELVSSKLCKRAKKRVAEFAAKMEALNSSKEQIDVIKGCAEPILISSLAYNMSGKASDDYSREEENIYDALKPYSEDISADLLRLGNFDRVKSVFREVVAEKEGILERKAGSFVSTATEELKNLLRDYIDKTDKRLKILESTFKEELLNKKRQLESQIGAVQADVAAVFGDLCEKIELEKTKGIQEIRKDSQDYMSVRERTGSGTGSRTYTTGWGPWKETERETYTTTYTYCLASDAVENLQKFAIEARNRAESVFVDGVELKAVRRKLLDVVVKDLDIGSEKYDAALFRRFVEEAVSMVEFPVFSLNISQKINRITGNFSGKLRAIKKREALAAVVADAVGNICESLCRKLSSTAAEFKVKMQEISHKAQDILVQNVSQELDLLLKQCENREKEIGNGREYERILEEELSKF